MKKSVFVIFLAISIILIGTASLVSVYQYKRYKSTLNDYNECAISYNDMAEQYNQLNSEYTQLSSDYDDLNQRYETLNSEYEAHLAAEEVVYDSPTDLSEYDTGITYDNIARNPDDYEGKAVKFSGKVIQIIEGEGETQMRFAVDGDYDKIIYCGYNPDILDSRILENDEITIYGISINLISYEAALGQTVTIPGVYIDYIETN